MESTRPWHSGRGDRVALMGITVVALMTALLGYAPIEIPIIND
jgi:hypothetical protein